MSDENQIEIPQSFITLSIPRGQLRPIASREFITNRYELCEDMATILTEHAQTMQFKLNVDKQDVLIRCHQGLLATDSVFTESESGWIIYRLAELLSWAAPKLAPSCDDTLARIDRAS